MFYINTSVKFSQIKQKELLTAIITPPEERQPKDHQLIYRYFNSNVMLKQLQRTKSLNARKKCIESLLLIKRIDYNKQQHILMHYFQDQRFIVLPIQVKIKAQMYDEKIIRKKLDLIKQFSVFQGLKYDQLLHLSVHLEEQLCKYKDFLYREGEQSIYCYLIVEGQFYYLKNCNEDQAGIHINYKKGIKRQISSKNTEREQQIPNKMVRSQIKQYKIGVIQGQLGQCVGLQQIVLDQQAQKRRYSIICNSTSTKIFKIHKQYILQIFEQFPYYKQKIKRQIQSAKIAKLQLFNKIKETKMNINQFIKKSTQLIQKQEVLTNMRTFEKSKQIKEQQNNRYKLPFVEKKSSFSLQNRNRGVFRSSLSVQRQKDKKQQSNISKLKSQSHIKSREKEDMRYQGQQDNQSIFDITALKDKSKLKNKNALQSQQSQISRSRQSLTQQQLKLPVIIQKSVTDIDYSSINLPDIVLKSKRRSQHYGAMIDSSKLIQQKQNIIDKKLNKVSRDEIFPIGHIEYKQPLRSNQQDPMKLKASPAHSNLFMQRLLMKVLKKAGYDEKSQQDMKEQLQQSNISKKVKVKRQYNRSLTKNKKKEEDKRQEIRQQLLVNSAFDDYYFKKF